MTKKLYLKMKMILKNDYRTDDNDKNDDMLISKMLVVLM